MQIVKAGESHGQAIVGILTKVPAGIEVNKDDIINLLKQRRTALGRSSRQKKEKDRVDIITGIRGGETLGNNIAMGIKNGAHSEFVSEMGVFDCDLQSSKITALRPGHADLGGISRGDFTDARSVMEGASARNTCIDAALGAVAISMLSMLGIEIAVEVRALGNLTCEKEYTFEQNLLNTSPAFSQNKQFISKCKKLIDEYKTDGDSLGGVVEITVSPIKAGIGGYVSENRVDALIAGLLMQTQAVKGVFFGENLINSPLSGTQYHGEIKHEAGALVTRSLSGGIDGGMTNGDFIKITVMVKPIPTTAKGVPTVDIESGESTISAKQRADTTAVFAICPVLKAKVALAISEAVCERLGCDNMKAIIERYNSL